jgi:hypothetical protein
MTPELGGGRRFAALKRELCGGEKDSSLRSK